ncbi:unnamed protein product [Paramecium sonneborni]|uniref:Uncharacterized protein n=1 Tax=Paramecium sonneborni TaxID=65129 RepID=A0A8S1JWA5_9CILI|nr:unnamed protein product [Paramecium sonneborni]
MIKKIEVRRNNIIFDTLEEKNETDDNFNNMNLAECGFGRQSFQRNSQFPMIQQQIDIE